MALTKANKKNKNKIFKSIQKIDGIIIRGYMSKGGSHPPKNNIAPIAHINKIFAYSPNLSLIHI